MVEVLRCSTGLRYLGRGSVENQADIAGNIHFYTAWGLIILAGLHAVAALKHHFINRDNTLRKMLTGASK